MPLFDFECEKCGHKEPDVVVSRDELDTKRQLGCVCGASMDRCFPIPARPHVEWTKPEFSYKHGKWVGSSKEVDVAEKKLKEPDMEAYAASYMREEAKIQAQLGEDYNG